MKNLLKFASLSLVMLLFVSSSFAQKKSKKVSEGHITYKMMAEGQMASMINGSTMDLYFAKDHAKMLMDMASGMVMMDVVIDNKKKKGLMLIDMMGQRKAAKMDEEDLKNQEEKQVNQKPQKVEYKKKFKKIAGYKCQEVHVTMEGFDEPAVVYVTEQLEPAHTEKLNFQFNQLKGFPLSWTIKKMGMTMTMEAAEVSLKKVDKKIFKMDIPDGYEEMTMDELQKLGGGGAMGM